RGSALVALVSGALGGAVVRPGGRIAVRALEYAVGVGHVAFGVDFGDVGVAPVDRNRPRGKLSGLLHSVGGRVIDADVGCVPGRCCIGHVPRAVAGQPSASDERVRIGHATVNIALSSTGPNDILDARYLSVDRRRVDDGDRAEDFPVTVNVARLGGGHSVE